MGYLNGYFVVLTNNNEWKIVRNVSYKYKDYVMGISFEQYKDILTLDKEERVNLAMQLGGFAILKILGEDIISGGEIIGFSFEDEDDYLTTVLPDLYSNIYINIDLEKDKGFRLEWGDGHDTARNK